MNREFLLNELSQYHSEFDSELNCLKRFTRLVKENHDAYQRSRIEGHVTASAWVIDPENKKALLLHHRKLQKWLQPGGHADGDENLIAVVRKELDEETGLKKIKLFSKDFFDLDIHIIPENTKEKRHAHYDVRYLFIGDANESPVQNHESNAIQWIAWENVAAQCKHEESILRMLKKTMKVFSRVK